MKLCFSTLPCGNLNVYEIADVCLAYNISAVEIRLDAENRLLHTKDIDTIKEYGRYLVSKNISVSNLGSSVCLTGYDEKAIGEVITCLDMAHMVGAKGVRVFLGNFCKRFDSPKIQLDNDGIIRALQELCAYGKAQVWVETHNEYATGHVLKRLIKDVNSHNLKIIWDIMHSLEDNESIHDTWNFIHDDIAHVHIKDGKKKEDSIWHDWKYTRLGNGDVSNKEVVNLLLKNGYDGYFSLEWENLWRPELEEFSNDIHWILNEFTSYMRN